MTHFFFLNIEKGVGGGNPKPCETSLTRKGIDSSWLAGQHALPVCGIADGGSSLRWKIVTLTDGRHAGFQQWPSQWPHLQALRASQGDKIPDHKEIEW